MYYVAMKFDQTANRFLRHIQTVRHRINYCRGGPIAASWGQINSYIRLRVNRLMSIMTMTDCRTARPNDRPWRRLISLCVCRLVVISPITDVLIDRCVIALHATIAHQRVARFSFHYLRFMSFVFSDRKEILRQHCIDDAVDSISFL